MIYILEDDDSIRELVVYSLNSAGLPAAGFARPSEFWPQLQKELPQLLILDIMLPEEDGIHILDRLRSQSQTERLPIIMLTAKTSEFDQVYGLNHGADDYVAKPFGMMALIARVKALLRRTETDGSPSAITIGSLSIFPDQRQVKADGHPVALTYKEFEVLYLLMQHPGMVFTREQLQDKIWGYEVIGESRTVDVHIRTLRQKLGGCGHMIETVRGVGYRFTGDVA